MNTADSGATAEVRDTVARLLYNTYAFNDRRRSEIASASILESLWPALADMGVLGIGIPEDRGGTGLGLTETCAVLLELGRAALGTPYAATALIAPAMLEDERTPWASKTLTGICDGSIRIGLAPDDFGFAQSCGLRATSGPGGVRLDGEKTMVVDAAACTHILTDIGADDAGRRRFACVPLSTQGVELHQHRLYDQRSAASVAFTSVTIPADWLVSLDLDKFEKLRTLYALGLAAETAGLVEILVAETLAYLKVRQAFGKPLDQNQALHHRMVDLAAAQEGVRSSVAMLLHAHRIDKPHKLHHAAMASLGRNAMMVGKEAVQLHGAIGVMLDHLVGAALPRLTLLQQLGGGTTFHVNAYARLIASAPVAARSGPLF